MSVDNLPTHVWNTEWLRTDTSSITALYETIEQAWQKAVEGFQATEGQAVACRPGCAECCKPHLRTGFKDAVAMAMSPPEAVLLLRALSSLPSQTKIAVLEHADALKIYGRFEIAPGLALSAAYRICPLLDPQTNLCVVYEGRPLVCRASGLPVRWRANDGYTHVACYKNRGNTEGIEGLYTKDYGLGPRMVRGNDQSVWEDAWGVVSRKGSLLRLPLRSVGRAPR